jgi:ParB-like chromosome segregation protein Spo0J
VLIGNVGSTTRFLHQLIENLQREDLNPVDKGEALARLKTMLPGTWQEVADRVGLTRRRVEQLRALPHMPQLLQEAVRGGGVSEDHARAIARLPEDWQAAVVGAVERHHLSTRRTKSLVKRLQESAVPMADGDAEHVAVAGDGMAALIDRAITSAGAEAGEGADEQQPARAPRPRSRAVAAAFEKAVEFERELDRLPDLEYQEDRILLAAVFRRIAAKLGAIDLA